MKMVRVNKMQAISSPKMRTNYMVYGGRLGNQIYRMGKSHSPRPPVALQGMRFY